jgi:hypothetical protein
LPGYEVEVQFIKLQSSKYPALYEVGEYIQGELLKSLFSCRARKLDQSPDTFNYGQEKYRRTHTYDAHCSDPHVRGRAITIQYAIHWYGAGAAHPNMHFWTRSFTGFRSSISHSNRRTGTPYGTIMKVWSRLRDRAGLPHLRIHDLRHQFASFLVNSGRSLYEVQQILGHSDPSVTQRYAHLSSRSLQEAANSASVAIRGAAGQGASTAITSAVIEGAAECVKVEVVDHA